MDLLRRLLAENLSHFYALKWVYLSVTDPHTGGSGQKMPNMSTVAIIVTYICTKYVSSPDWLLCLKASKMPQIAATKKVTVLIFDVFCPQLFADPSIGRRQRGFRRLCYPRMSPTTRCGCCQGVSRGAGTKGTSLTAGFRLLGRVRRGSFRAACRDGALRGWRGAWPCA